MVLLIELNSNKEHVKKTCIIYGTRSRTVPAYRKLIEKPSSQVKLQTSQTKDSAKS